MNRSRSTLLRGVSLFTLVAALAIWLIGGAHLGWTQTSVVEMQYDDITEISYPVHRDAFVPGIEFLAGGITASLALFGCGLLPSRQKVRSASRII